MRRFLILAAAALVLAAPALAQKAEEKKAPGAKGPPPALVAVAPVASGAAEPFAEFVGTVRFARVSEVASEVEGIVQEALFEEGQAVGRGDALVTLNADLLQASIGAARAEYEAAGESLEQAKKDLARMEPLYRDASIAEVAYDNQLYKARGLQKKVEGLKAALHRQELMMARKTIASPFDGLVLQRNVERGEWVTPGGTVAVIAEAGRVEVLVDVPSHILGFLQKGRQVEVTSGGRGLTARFVHVVPKGDVATRTFTVKLGVQEPGGLLDGMEARALLPTGPRRSGLLVPRDAVLDRAGQDVVFAVQDGRARMIPVKVTGYSGLDALVEAEGLSEGMQVVVKGNERIGDGAPVVLQGGPQGG